jgi:hypothetical protein
VPIKLLGQRADGAKRQITGKNRANRRGLGRDYHDLLVHRRIAEGQRAADPKAFALGGGDLVAHPLADQFPFELGKDSSTLRVSRPMLELVLKDCVTVPFQLA